MGLFRSMAGCLRVAVTGPDISASLAAMMEAGIEITDAQMQDEVTVAFSIPRNRYRKLRGLCVRRGDELRLLKRFGLYWTGKAMAKRPVLLAGLAFVLALTLWLPGRVLFVRVEGNRTVPVNLVVETAADCGIRFGASRREVRSERMKNALLEQLPQLQWAGVNTAGCVATISVRERRETPGTAEEGNGVSSIVAACDGVILSATVTSGSAMCAPGQAVSSGQVLISGYQDLGIAIRATRAEGEIFAATRRELRAITLLSCLKRADARDSRVRYCLIVGKKRINLWKGSGICDAGCGRMYEEYYITLPGGFVLPFGFGKETVIEFPTEPGEVSAEDAGMVLRNCARNRLQQMMISGTISSEQVHITESGRIYTLEGVYYCTEMIGRNRQEKIGE